MCTQLLADHLMWFQVSTYLNWSNSSRWSCSSEKKYKWLKLILFIQHTSIKTSTIVWYTHSTFVSAISTYTKPTNLTSFKTKTKRKHYLIYRIHSNTRTSPNYRTHPSLTQQRCSFSWKSPPFLHISRDSRPGHVIQTD